MKTVILDTNFLLIPIQFGVDIFSEMERVCLFKYRLCIVDKTLDELKQISLQGKTLDKKAAKVALQLISKRGIDVVAGEGSKADDIIVSLCDEDTIVGTNDRGLKRRVHAQGSQVLSLRQEKFLILV